MRGNSRINKQEQVKVVIRLKPQQSQSKYSKCVYLSDQDQNELVVETDNKKQIFKFDHVAHQLTSQQDIYRMIGQECVLQTFEGYNCCIFAYGQTGAGKTYSVLGSTTDLSIDLYCQSRGILPRVLEDLFQETKNRSTEKQSIICSYMEIYNEQVFDLLSTDKRIHQIRQDAKKGVFVEGLIERKVSSYKAAASLLLQGEKTRKMATTMMNNESSRSHAIFSINIESNIMEEDVIISKKAKLHIIDLAGSERVKHTNVEGQRLRQGCNINRSLHVLSNVINSLVESTKRKKHIPFRDSKLTHYLKDSLGGNSVTKLLANVHTSKNYFGDTLSTLMFAKRAKILKMKVELNETSTGNFDALRKEVRRLRQQLAQAKYFKPDGKMSDRSAYQQDFDSTLQRIATDNEEQPAIKQNTLQILEENQMHFKVLIEIYEQHMKTCLSSSQFQRKHNINIINQWKNLEKRNISLTNLVKRLPSFTKIYRQNLLLRQSNKEDNVSKKSQKIETASTEIEVLGQAEKGINKSEVTRIISYYQAILSQAQQKFKECLEALQKNYLQLQLENKQKQKKIKDLRKRKQYPPDIEQLKNQNQYLHLSIFNLENQIIKLQQNQQKIKIQLKQSKKSTARKESRENLNDSDEKDEFYQFFYQQLIQIKNQALRQAEQYEIERSQMQLIFQKHQAEINKMMMQNNKLLIRGCRSSKSRKKKSNRSQVQQLDITNELTESKDQILFSSKTVKFQNDELKSLQQNFTKEVLVLKMDIKRKQKQIADLKKQLEQYINGDKKIQDEFGKPLQEIIEQYRQLQGRRTLLQSKSVKVFQPWKQEGAKRTPPMDLKKQDKAIKKTNNGNYK